MPIWVSAFLFPRGLERTARHQPGKKVSSGHFFSPWESPLICRRIWYGCGCKSSLVIGTGIRYRRQQKADAHLGIYFLFIGAGKSGSELRAIIDRPYEMYGDTILHKSRSGPLRCGTYEACNHKKNPRGQYGSGGLVQSGL